jgi:hypothetical protein
MNWVVISQKAAFFIVIAVDTSNLITGFIFYPATLADMPSESTVAACYGSVQVT